MFNRRFIRIKVFQTIYAFMVGTYDDLYSTEKDLKYTFDRIYDLYHFLMLLIIELANHFKKRYDNYQNFHIKKPNDIANKHIKLYNNLVINQLRNNPYLNSFLQKRKFTWQKNPELINVLFNKIVKLNEYKEYTKNIENNFNEDKDFLLFIIEAVLYRNDNFIFAVEEDSFYYTDNTEFALFSVALTIEKFKQQEYHKNRLFEKFKNQSDEEFAITLLNKTLINLNKNTEIITKNIVNKEYEIISLIDKIILLMAIAEIEEFKEIPVKVSMNEYIDLAKEYGIPNKSFAFINGLLDKIVQYMKNENLINKTGRGLIEK